MVIEINDIIRRRLLSDSGLEDVRARFSKNEDFVDKKKFERVSHSFHETLKKLKLFEETSIVSTPLNPAQSSLRPPPLPTHSPDDSNSPLPINLSDEDFVLDYKLPMRSESKDPKLKKSSNRLPSRKSLRNVIA